MFSFNPVHGYRGYDSSDSDEGNDNKVGNFRKTNANINHSGGQVGGNFSTTNGNISLSGSTVVQDLNASSTNGSINLSNLALSKERNSTVNVSTTNGSSTLTNVKFLDKVSSTNGSIDLENSKANYASTTNGRITLANDAQVKNVQCPSRRFKMSNSSITGTLTASIEDDGRLKIGPSSVVNKIILKASSNGTQIFSVGATRGSMNFASGNISIGSDFSGSINGNAMSTGSLLKCILKDSNPQHGT